MSHSIETIISKIQAPLTTENIASVSLAILSMLVSSRDITQSDYPQMTTDALNALIEKQSLSAEDKMNLTSLVRITVPQVVQSLIETVEVVETGGCCSFGKSKKKKARASPQAKQNETRVQNETRTDNAIAN